MSKAKRVGKRSDSEEKRLIDRKNARIAYNKIQTQSDHSEYTDQRKYIEYGRAHAAAARFAVGAEMP
jgi:hypothetical protein